MSWIVDPDATVSIDQGIGSVDAQTMDGIGELQITAPDVPADTAIPYTLTVSKGGEEATRTLTLILKQGVAKLFADFESPDALDSATVSHSATLTLVGDVPSIGGGSFAAKTVLDAAANAEGFFSTAFPLPEPQDLTDAFEISLWIKTDIAGNFNFQAHSSDAPFEASVFTFSTADFTRDTWNQIIAPLESFANP